MRASRTIAAVLLGVVCAGCVNRPQNKNGGAIVEGALPAYEDVAARYNARVEHLDAVDATAQLVVTSVDKEGRSQTDQGEGNLKMIRPREVALRIDKVSQTFFFLGSNAERYYWFNLRGEDKVVLVGAHDKVTPENAARLGFPVHPLDLLDLAGVSAIPATGGTVVRWVRKSVEIELPGRWGVKRLVVDPSSGEASDVTMLNGAGEVVVEGKLSKYVTVEVRGNAAATGRMATKLEAKVPGSKSSVVLEINSPFNPTRERIKPGNFDFEGLKSRFGPVREIDVDAAAGAGQ